MSTPEITNMSNKLSPFGSGINKRLLTPCRRIGLSRKRKTPSSIVKILSEESGNTAENSPTTPINTKKRLIIKRSNTNSDSFSPLSILKIAGPSVKDSIKKNLVQNFSKDLIIEKKTIIEDMEPGMCSINIDEVMLAEPQLHCEIETKLNKKSIAGNISNSNPCLEENECRSDNSLSDDDFQTNVKTVKKLKTKESFKDKKLSVARGVAKMHTKSKSEDLVEHLRECKIFIPKLSNEDINCMGNHNLSENIPDDLSDDEIVGKIKKKRMIISSDEEGDFCVVPKKCKISPIEDETGQNKKSQKVKCNSPKVSNTATNLPTVINISDDDDFTSTPDHDKFQKRDLMDKVKYLETQMKEKRKKLEDLKQASVYKTKHNVEELMMLVGKWKEGCVLGLNGLLTQLKNHGPIDMPLLLKNLQISNEVVIKLGLNVPAN
ncbi:unnamed protein product [Phaedon cochleariae]|uniref:Swi5-dependent recombination DNA repair protein 1 homolog n=1 Tax=Phaedon cochleariae TaxID=80249 RepID=A0A9N9SH44_PHACE|nr:unnamed protein product [Phaedon cochleariae]